MPKHILLADDSITIQKVIALTFAGEDYKITSVNNGVDALTRAKALKPDVILADVVMPQKNGYEVCAAIKKDPETSTIPVLLLAGTFEPFDEDLARKAGADSFIIKPFESQALIQKVRELIGSRPSISAAPQPAPRLAPPVPPTPVTPAAKPIPSPGVPPKVPSIVPVIAPVPPTRPKPAAAPPEPPVAAPPSEEDFWGTMMDEVEEKEAPKELPSEAAQKAVSEEEVWQIGEFEEAPAAKEEEIWETFAFEEGGVGEVEESMETAEEEFAFAEEIGEEAAEEFAFTEELPEVPSMPSIKIEPQPEIIQGYEQTFEPEAIAEEIPKAAPARPLSAPPSAVPVSEEQLRVALSQVSREVIEKIVWEVVPDLAEMLIKEEIKRLQKKQ